MKLELYSKKLEDTQDIAKIFASFLKKGDVVGFSGDLGAGKTTFIKEIAEYFEIDKDEVISTSFVLVRQYEGSLPIMHTDVYRLADISEIPLEILEFIDSGEGIVLMEWVTNVDIDVVFNISLRQERLDERIIEVEGSDARLEEIEKNLEQFVLRL